ncbi:hypothetical protein UPYG_G00154300 [Umbra pygmaea]|uniref:Uncharacterized protein n=1 Tax=Umbra pygmaea TaxID=75934 RepID=A0ABD0WXS6_UMBPY
MEQREKGGPSAPSTHPLPPPAPPEQHPEKRTRREKDPGGAVLEVFIEGQRQLPFPGRERSCAEGSVRLRIGVQTAKRSKKPPRTLEGYECVPTVRTQQRPGRGLVVRGEQEGGGSGQGDTPQEWGEGGKNQGSDPNTSQTTKIHPSSPSPQPSSSSSTGQSSGPPHTLPGKWQVPLKLAHKTEMKSDTPPRKLGHRDPAGAHSQLSTPAQSIQETLPDFKSSSPHSHVPPPPPFASVKDSSDEASVGGEGGILNGGEPPVSCHPTRRTKVKGRKQDYTSSVLSNVNSVTRPQLSSPLQADPASQDRTASSTCPLTPAPSPSGLQSQRGAPVSDGGLSPAASQGGLSWATLSQSSGGTEREDKAKKKKEKCDQVRTEKGQGERKARSQGKEERGNTEYPRKERCEKARQEREEVAWRESHVTGKEEEAQHRETPKHLSGSTPPCSSTRCQLSPEAESSRMGAPGAEPALTSVSDGPPTEHTDSPPASFPPPPPLPCSSSTSPREQDSRPLKKRKTRRPSWTRQNRAQRLADNPDVSPLAPLAVSNPQRSPTGSSHSPLSAEPRISPPPPSPSSLSTTTSTPVKPRPAGQPASSTQTHQSPCDPSPSAAVRKRGRPKSQMPSSEKTPPRHFTMPPATILPAGHGKAPDPPVPNPVLDFSPDLTKPSSPSLKPRKRGRPKRPKQPFLDNNRVTLSPLESEEDGKRRPSERSKGNLRCIMGEMKRRRLLREKLSGCRGGGGGGGGERRTGTCRRGAVIPGLILRGRFSSALPHPTHPPHPHLPISPAHLKEATPSAISQSPCGEVLPRASGIDPNNVSEGRGGRGQGKVTVGVNSEVTRSVFQTGLGVGLKGRPNQPPPKLLEHPTPVLSPLRLAESPPSSSHRAPVSPPSSSLQPCDRQRRSVYQCPYTCLCHGHHQRSLLHPCLTHKTPKRQKHKRKRKYQHLLMHAHDPDFLSELDDLIGQFSEVRIGRNRDWTKAGLGRKLAESGRSTVGGKRRHSSSLSSHHFRSNVYRINLSGYYSPHPISYPPHPTFPPLQPCHSLPHTTKKPGRRLKCGCPAQPSQEQGECVQGQRCPLQGNTGYLHPSSLSAPSSMPLGLGYYRGYPITMAHYPNPPIHASYPPPYAPQQPHLHPPHLLLNPARFHRRRSRQLCRRDGGGEDSPGTLPGLPCGCGTIEHKLRHKHRHRTSDWDPGRKESGSGAGSQPRSEFTVRSAQGGSRRNGGQGHAGLMESPWQRKYANDLPSFSSAAKPASSSPSPSSSSAERRRSTALTCLGSTHLSTFGEGWGGQPNPWLRKEGLGAGFRPPTPTLGTLTGGQRPTSLDRSEREDSPTAHHNTFTSLTQTNLFTSSTGGRGDGNERANWRPGSQDVLLRREELPQKEKRSTGPHYGLSQRKQTRFRPGQSVGARRGPGRPRKKIHLTDPVNTMPEPTIHHRDRNRGDQGTAGEGGGDTVQEVIEAVIQRQRRRGRKRQRVEIQDEEEEEHPLCFHSSGEGDPVTHTASICTGQSELCQSPSLVLAGQSDEGVDQLPIKMFQRAGLYSDDYKTTEQSQRITDKLEFIPGEHDYSLLPAPIHVGKYLRMRRIDFQLPYDIIWLLRHNQLHKQCDASVTSEISTCQPKQQSVSRSQTSSPQEGCSSPRKKLLFPHLDMEPMSTSDRVFVLKHRVFLLRNWAWVRGRQLRLSQTREGGPQRSGGGTPSNADAGDKNSKSGGAVGVTENVVLTSVDLHEHQCPPNPPGTSSSLWQPPNRQQEEVWREVQKERLNNILLKLRQPSSGGMSRRGNILVKSLFFHQVVQYN